MPAKRKPRSRQPTARPYWSFLSNHALVAVCIAEDPDIRLRDVAEHVGITERAVQRIVADLEEAGYLKRRRDGRRNHYELHLNKSLRHTLGAHRNLSELVDFILEPE